MTDQDKTNLEVLIQNKKNILETNIALKEDLIQIIKHMYGVIFSGQKVEDEDLYRQSIHEDVNQAERVIRQEKRMLKDIK